MSQREPIRISVDEANEMIERDEATALDVIDSHSYDDFDLQIKGAVRIAPKKLADQFKKLPKDRTVLAY